MIHFDSVSVETTDAPAKTLLQNIRLDLSENRVAVIGENGSGKSTLIRLINGLVAPTTGRVLIDQDSGAQLDTVKDGTKVRRQVAFAFTDPRSQLVMPTPLEDVELSLKRVVKDKKMRSQMALDALERFGLASQANQSVYSLSGGQLQLLALASVLSVEPSILVADEPTTLLDLKNTKLVSDILMSLEQQLVVATHNLELAARCDRVLVIGNGRVIFDGDPIHAIAFYREQSL